jgi:putative acetyltransferase
MDQTFAYYRSVLAGGHTHFVAVRGTALLGWCDVLPLSGQMRAHAGTLGMAVAAAERGKGIGRQLILAAISAAEAKGLRRIELTVHAENQAAQALYSRVGFEYEGTQRRGWCLDGAFFDVHHMARVSDA